MARKTFGDKDSSSKPAGLCQVVSPFHGLYQYFNPLEESTAINHLAGNSPFGDKPDLISPFRRVPIRFGINERKI